MSKHQYKNLDIHLILQDQFEDAEGFDIVSGIAIRKDDLAAFVADFEELARKYGGATYEELLDDDLDDASLDSSIRRYDDDLIKTLVDTAERIANREL